MRFRVKEESGDWECRFVPQIKMTFFSRWKNVSIHNNDVRTGKDWGGRYKLPGHAWKVCEQVRKSILYDRKHKSGLKAKNYHY